MAKVRNVTVVLSKGFEDELDLWGVFETYEKAVASIQNQGMRKSKPQLLCTSEHPELADGIVNEEQDWDAIVYASIEDPDTDDVWGYLIMDRIQ